MKGKAGLLVAGVLVLALSLVIGVVLQQGSEPQKPDLSFLDEDVRASGIKATNVTWLVAKKLTVKNDADFLCDISLEGNCIELDADNDTSLCADTDDQVDVEIAGVDTMVWLPFPTATTTTATVNILEVMGSTPAWTANTNVVNAFNIDISVGNANTGTHTVRGVMIDGITGDAQVSETAIEMGSGWDVGLDVNGLKIELDVDADTSITADTDDQIDFELGGADIFVMNEWGAAAITTDTTEYLLEIVDSTPVMTAGTNALAGLNIDLDIGNSTAGTNSVYGILIDDISQDAQNTETAIDIAGTGWDVGIGLGGNVFDLDADDDTSIRADTDDEIDFEVSGQDVISFTASAGYFAVDVYPRFPALAKTADYTALSQQSGALFTNQGASGEITITLPAATASLGYCFYVFAAQTMTLELDNADQFHHLTNAAGDRVQNTGTAGDSVCFYAVSGVYWVPMQEVGTWSDVN